MRSEDSLAFVEDLGQALVRVIEEQSTQSDRTRRSGRLRGLIVAAIALAVLVGVVQPITRNDPNLLDQSLAFAAALPILAMDYDPSPSPNALAAISDVVVYGQIREFTIGRTYGNRGEPGFGETAVMKIDVLEVVYGSLPDPSHPSLYFEIRLDNQGSPDLLNRVAPFGARVLVYAVAMGPPYAPTVDDGRGLPEGHPLMRVTSPQGFLIGVESGVFLGLYGHGLPGPEHVVAKGLDLEAFAPPGESWPVPHAP